MKFKTLSLLILLLFSISKSSSPVSSDKYKYLDEIVKKYLDRISVLVVPLDGSEAYKRNQEEAFVSASMIKLLILCKFMEEIDKGTISLLDFYAVRQEDKVDGGGIIKFLEIGTEVSYDQLALYMIMYSDNTATNVLIDILGMDAINQKAKDMGLKNTTLNRKMYDWESGLENYICSDDVETILKAIYYRKIATEETSSLAMSYLLKNVDWEGIQKGLPKGTKYAHKTGALDWGINHDGGLVFAPNKYIINVLTRNFTEPDALTLMNSISLVTYKILNNN